MAFPAAMTCKDSASRWLCEFLPSLEARGQTIHFPPWPLPSSISINQYRLQENPLVARARFLCREKPVEDSR